MPTPKSENRKNDLIGVLARLCKKHGIVMSSQSGVIDCKVDDLTVDLKGLRYQYYDYRLHPVNFHLDGVFHPGVEDKHCQPFSPERQARLAAFIEDLVKLSKQLEFIVLGGVAIFFANQAC